MEVYRPEDAFAINLRTFKLFGVWPSSIKHPMLRFIYKLYGFAIHMYYIIGVFPPLFMNLYMKHDNLEEVINNCVHICSCVAYATKFFIFLLRRKKIEEFLQRLNGPIFLPRQKDHLNILKKSTTIAQVTSITFLSLAFLTWTFWISLPLFKYRKEKTLPYISWYPYNVTMNPAYVYTYITQTIHFLTTCAMASMLDIMATNFYVIMVGQMDILKQEFSELADFSAVNDSKEAIIKFSNKNSVVFESIDYNGKKLVTHFSNFHNINKAMLKNLYIKSTHSVRNVIYNNEKELVKILNDRIIHCLLRYEAIMKFVSDVTNLFQIGIVVQVCVSSVVICTTSYVITTISPATFQFYKYMLYQGCMLFEIFIYTWRCNDVTIKTTELKDAVYNCKWMSVPSSKFRKSLCTIMSHLQVPLTICVGKFFLLSVDTFLKIMKMSYSLFVLLKQVNDQNK